MNKLVSSNILLFDLTIRPSSLSLKVRKNKKVSTSVFIKDNLEKNVKLFDTLTSTLNSIIKRIENLIVHIQSNSILIIFN